VISGQRLIGLDCYETGWLAIATQVVVIVNVAAVSKEFTNTCFAYMSTILLLFLPLFSEVILVASALGISISLRVVRGA